MNCTGTVECPFGATWCPLHYPLEMDKLKKELQTVKSELAKYREPVPQFLFVIQTVQVSETIHKDVDWFLTDVQKRLAQTSFKGTKADVKELLYSMRYALTHIEHSLKIDMMAEITVHVRLTHHNKLEIYIRDRKPEDGEKHGKYWINCDKKPLRRSARNASKKKIVSFDHNHVLLLIPVVPSMLE
jgi:Holliday junction resolvase RusA-like endonuclease